MNTSTKYNQQHPLNWIKPELEKTVKTVRDLFESYSQELDDNAPLEKIQAELHLLHGSFEMLKLHGAALLVDDMEKALQVMGNSSKKNKEDIFEALLHATLTLDSYIDKLDVNNSGVPLAILPIINDIRASIKQPLLSESALFLPNLSIIPKIPLHTHSEERLHSQLRDYAVKLRPYYQAALLSWFRNPKDQMSLQQLRLVARNFEAVCLTPRNRQIWWILGGLFEAMQDKGLNTNVSLRLILGQADRVIKSFCQGETNIYEKTPPIEFLKNALFYISQASSNGERVNALKSAYQLENATPSEDDIYSLQHGNNSPNSETFTLISSELSKSLEQIKATIENFVRNTQDNPVRLKQTTTQLKHVSDTLSMLNLGAEKQRLQEQIDIINRVIATNKAPSHDIMLEIASAILDVETSLQNIGKTGVSSVKTDTSDPTITTENPELTRIAEKTALEAQSNITQIKNQVLAYLASNQTEKESIKDIPRLLTEIKGCLIILNNQQASKIANALLEYVENELMKTEEPIPSSDLDTLAETIVSLECYFETVMDPNTSTDAIIEVARSSVNKLGFFIPSILVSADENKASDDLANIHDIALNTGKRKPKKEEQRFPRKTKDNNSADEELIDKEIPDIFIEEAVEELEHMRNDLRALQFSMDDPASLASIRKTFHTLKGSGRIAGAIDISELASLLNDYISRVMCGALQAEEKTVSILQDAHEIIHELIDCFKDRSTPPDTLGQITETIKNIIGPIPEPPKTIPKLSEVIPFTRNIKKSKKDNKKTNQKNKAKQQTIDKVQELLQAAITQIVTIDSFVEKGSDGASQHEMLEAISLLQECAKLSNAREFIHTTDLLAKYIANASTASSELNDESLEILKEFCTTTREILFDLAHTLSPVEITGNIPLLTQQPEASNDSSNHSHIQTLTDTAEQPLALVGSDTNSEEETAKSLTSSSKVINPSIPVLTSDSAEKISLVKSNTESISTENHPTPTTEPPEYDVDLIEIFMEEAVELIESENNIIEEYERGKDADKLYAATQRILHTMKGSSRMAGVTYIGDLSHLLETKIEAISSKRIPRPDNLIEIIQHCFDHVNDTIEDIRNGKNIVQNQALLDKISSDETKPAAAADLDTKANSSIEEGGHATSVNIPKDNSAADEPTLTNRITAPATSEKTSTASSEETQVKQKTDTKNHNNIARTDRQKSGSVKVDANILDSLVNHANEENAISSRIADHVNTIKTNLSEMDKTVTRALAQMRDLQFEAHNLAAQNSSVNDQFDMNSELNLSTFSEGQKITQRLMESFGDIESLHGLITRLTLETDTLIIQQKKIHTELQESLLNTRMVTFSVQTQRMQRILRQTCISLRKKAKLTLEGTEGSVDRSVLETLMGPMEHIIRNAAAHGIETPTQRKKSSKREAGSVHIKFSKDRSEHLIEISDDGMGIDLERVKKKALAVGLITPEDDLPDDELCNLVFKPGFTTCDEVSQISGRGVGMDVAINEIRQLGGSLSVSSTSGKGSIFTIRLPFTVSSNRTLFVKVGKNTYALPSNMIEHTFSITQPKLERIYKNDSPCYHFSEQEYPLWNMESLLNNEPTHLPEKHIDSHIVLLRNGVKKIALQVDEINESRDSVLKPASPQLNNIRGIAGATVLGDGKVVLIIDVPSLILYAESKDNKPSEIIHAVGVDDETIRALVVDDSITVRKVTERFLNRHNIMPYTAIDGVDALKVLENVTPHVMLVDIEMPNMDGLELTKNVRANEKLKDIPIIMITSRTGKQHREKARKLGVNTFLPKPYQEVELIENIQSLTGKQILALG